MCSHDETQVTRQKLLDGEHPFESSALLAMCQLVSNGGSAFDALESVDAYWPPLGAQTHHVCDVCGAPNDACSVSVCESLRGYFNLLFGTYSTARVLEPLMREFGAGSTPEASTAVFFQELAFETLARCRASLSSELVALVIPNTNAHRGWSLNGTIWPRALARSGIPVLSDLAPPTRRPRRGLLEPGLYADTGVPCDAPVLLVDDFWTTGATMGTVALSLRRRGARKVVGCTLGRQLRPDSPGGRQLYLQLSSA